MPSRTVVTTWIESATATTVTMIGTPELVGLNTTPIQPANPHGSVDGKHEHGDDGRCAENRAQKQGRDGHDDEEYDWRQRLEIIRGGFGERVVQGDVTGHVIVDAGMARAGLVEEQVEILGDLDHRPSPSRPHYFWHRPCRRYFSVTVGTCMHSRRTELQHWVFTRCTPS